MVKTNTEIAENTFQAGTANASSNTAGKYLVSHMQTHEQFFSPISIKFLRRKMAKRVCFIISVLAQLLVS